MKTKILALLAAAVLLTACGTAENPKETQKKMTNTNESAQETTLRHANITTKYGVIKVELDITRAPITTANFIKLVEDNFYDGLTFHRVEPGFVVQGGDPLGTGMGGSDTQIPLEISPELRHVEGALAMARSANPNSASSQFYITLAPTPFLDDNYAVFGKVTEGMDAVKKIRIGDKMEVVEMTD